MNETLNEQTPPINEMDETLNEQTPPVNAAPGNEDVTSSLPAQYSEGNAGFFNRQNEAVPTAVTVGPDGALYASELSALPYPEGYASVVRIDNPEGDASYDGETPGGVSQTYASGFEQINGLTFDEDGALYVLEYVNASTVYDPSLPVEELPASRLIRVDPDGARQQISGEELRFGNYVFAHEGKIYTAINNGDIDKGQVLAYEQNPETGEWSHEVVAENLNNPRGMDIGPDGNLYVLEVGKGTPADDPNVDDALSIEFIPGLVSQRAGYTAAISRIDLENGSQERIYEGLPSTIEYNPNTGEDRIVSIGSNGMAIGDDGTVWISSGGGLSDESADALGEFGEGLRGVLKLDGLFGEDPSQATWTPTFDSVQYAGENGPDGATTLFNTQSNLNDIEVGPDGNLYTVDAARNVMYGISPDGQEVESVTVLQKTPPVLTPVQYALVQEAGGDPSADYSVEISERTFKGENDLPDTPGRQQALANGAVASTESGTDSEIPEGSNGEAPSSPPQQDIALEESASDNGEPSLRGEDAAIGSTLGEGQITAPLSTLGDPTLEQQVSADGLPVPEADTSEGIDLPDDTEVLVATTADDLPTEVPGLDQTTPPPEGVDANEFDPLNPGLVPGVEQSVLTPGPIDPTAPVITEGNPFADYFDPFFGVYSPAQGEEPVLPDGEDGYTVDDLFVFGDRLTENGGEFGKNAVAESTGANPPYDEAPYSPDGSFTDGSNWTTYLASILGVENDGEQDTNFSYLDATARELENPTDPFGEATELNSFAGQIDTFKQTYGTFTEDDLVAVNFGGNDLTLPPEEGVTPEQAAQQSIQATVDGIASLQELGAKNFLVGLVPPVELAPIFGEQEFLDLLGVEPGFFEPVVESYNQALTAALDNYEVESGANIEILDTNALFNDIAAEPGSYGFVNVEEPVLSSKTPVTGEPIAYNPEIVGEDPAVQHSTLFLDPYFHPTALGHSIVAETARDELLNLGDDISGSTFEETGITVGLYDADTDTLIAPLKNGTQIQASEVAGKNLTIAASVPEDSVYFEQVESVFLNLNDGQVAKTENLEPYALFGNDNEEYSKGGIDMHGEQTIAFELYSQDNLGGEMLGNINLDFSIV
ncbi:hypothetical protein C7B62_06180 [Pleurocapsa sp. CCALA 161]|uniref:ScyD/ScyE family protein n=1 Tax=Pleurocapsa sp. CCALA 161 TaxID=2107688 RepID=UPI000D061F1F|nr:ScyD/ScyE family protein [Pleurocapsa sp. CCALA 161]PSB11248.1 hypothetical protein C7B62_06180 [Pleurocapsa sp. CCALA 161]